MTRINCVPVEELHQKHLVAEYRELPCVFKLAEAAAKRGGVVAPDEYTLGAGHVKYWSIVNELQTAFLRHATIRILGPSLRSLILSPRQFSLLTTKD